jgi:hypothetical protein
MRNALRDGLRLGGAPSRKAIAAREAADGIPVSGEQVAQWNLAIDRLTRWNVFLTHTNINANDVVDTVTGGTPTATNSFNYETSQ